MRKLVVGDIHGALIALIQCLTRCSYDYTKDKLIFLGDYVDGWSHSSELIQYLIDIDKKAKYGTVFLRGNHDKWCEECLLRGQSPSMWVEQGGKATLQAYEYQYPYITPLEYIPIKHLELLLNSR